MSTRKLLTPDDVCVIAARLDVDGGTATREETLDLIHSLREARKAIRLLITELHAVLAKQP